MINLFFRRGEILGLNQVYRALKDHQSVRSIHRLVAVHVGGQKLGLVERNQLDRMLQGHQSVGSVNAFVVVDIAQDILRLGGDFRNFVLCRGEIGAVGDFAESFLAVSVGQLLERGVGSGWAIACPQSAALPAALLIRQQVLRSLSVMKQSD